MAAARGVTPGYWAVMAGLLAGTFVLPTWVPALWSLAGTLAAASIVLGVMRHRPRRLWPWGLLAAAMLFATTGDAIYHLVDAGGPRALLVVASALYVTFFACAATALAILSRSASPTRNRAGLLDAATVVVAFGLVVWVRAVGPRIGSLGFEQAASMLGYLAGDVLLLASVARLVTARRPMAPVRLLAAGVVAMLVGDLLFSVAGIDVARVSYLLAYAAWGAAGLHPSMARLTEPEVLPDWDISTRRLQLLVLTSLTGPAVLLVQSLQGRSSDGVLIALATAVIFVLNLVRVSDAAAATRVFLAHRERHDTLTGLANRALFTERLAELMATPAQTRPEAAILLLDLDGFKLLNDTMGHSSGDEVLVEVARRISRNLGRRDLAARFGGDEFAVLVIPPPDPDGVASLDDTVARIAAALAEPVTLSSRTVRVTASMGVATFADAGLSPGSPQRRAADLLGYAGLALQAAQGAGHGQWLRYESELHGVMVERMRLRSALDRAVLDGSFTLQFQPIVALDSGATAGFEALVRWEHPIRGVVGPDEFIHTAEETGLIEPIGDWVLHGAVTAATAWHRTLTAGVYVSVNVSVHQLRQGRDGTSTSFAERVDRELAAAGLPPRNLMLELTESVLLGEEDEVWAELATLRNTGVRLAIDDFGTGFASMRYLLDTPIDVIKIDKTFVRSLASSPPRQALVEGIVRLGARLGLRVVAEGIETAADRDLLAEMGCPYGQGFLYSAPLSGAESNRWLAGTAAVDGRPGAADDPDEYARSGGGTDPPGTLPQ